MRKWTLDLTELKRDMLETWDYWKALRIDDYPIPHAKVIWDYPRIQEHGKLFWAEKLALENQSHLYGEGELPQVPKVIYWAEITKEEIEPFLKSDRLLIEVYETEDGMDGDIVVAVNGTALYRSNKKRLQERVAR